jgi:hypothetical protein|tara:strand:+ start:149 stop:574 length:426 start_codon:yes stop_codon:yes gene_type:complete
MTKAGRRPNFEGKKYMFKKIVMTGAASLALMSAANAENPVNPAHVGVVKTKYCSSDGRDYFTQNGDGTFTISNFGSFEATAGRNGGRPDGNPVINTTINGFEVRFEWLSTERLEIEFWQEGQRAGQTRNNPAMATYIYTRC